MLLGEILVGRGMASAGDIEAALRRQREQGGRLGAHLIAMGLLTSHQLSALLQEQRDITAAIPVCERALGKWQAAYGAQHPNTARTRCNLARLQLLAGRPAEALELVEPALTALRTALGAKHPWTAESAQVAAAATDALERISRLQAVVA